MKRKELKVGGMLYLRRGNSNWEIAHATPVVCMAIEPWVEAKRYMGRFGNWGTGSFHQAESFEARGGVAVAERTRDHDGSDNWRPAVYQLTRLVTAAQQERDYAAMQAQDNAVAQRRKAQRARKDRIDRAMAARGLGGTISPSALFDPYVRIRFEDLEKLLGLEAE